MSTATTSTNSTAPDPSGWRTAVRRLTVLDRLALVVFVWLVLITTAEGFTVISWELSRTRQLFTVYTVVILVVLAGPWRRWAPLFNAAVAVMSLMLMLGVLFWTSMLDWSESLNNWAQWLLPFSGFLLAATYAKKQWVIWRGLLVAYGLFIAVYQIVALAFFNTTQPDSATSWAFYGTRTISWSQSLLVVYAFILAMDLPTLSRRNRAILMSFLGISVIIAQHRSAWVALLIATALVLFRQLRTGRLRADCIGPLVTLGAFAVAAVLPAVTSLSILPGNSNTEGLPGSFQATSTTGWRWEMWTSRMTTSRSPGEWLIGGVFGPTPAWGPSSQVLVPQISSHNLYVDTVTMLGIVGVICFAVFFVLAVRSKVPGMGSVQVALVATLGFGMFYQWPTVSWMLLGLASATAGSHTELRSPTAPTAS